MASKYAEVLRNRNNTDFAPPTPLSSHHESTAEPRQYKNAREYAQALRPWLWQHYTLASMQCFFASLPPFLPPTSFVPSPTNGTRQNQTSVIPNGLDQNLPPSVTHRFQGVQCTIPPIWKRVAAELVDFTILFYIKLIATVMVMRELGLMDTVLDYTFLDNLDDLDYERAFAITYEVIAMEAINRVLITFFETLCLRRGIGLVGGSTPGKRLLGLRVIRCNDFQDLGNNRVLIHPASDIGWISAFIRSAIKNFAIAFFFPACLTVFLFKHNRTAYDMLSNTIVVDMEELL